MGFSIRTKLALTFVAALLSGVVVLVLVVGVPAYYQLERPGGTWGPSRVEAVARERVVALESALKTGADATELGAIAIPPDLPAGGRVQVIAADGHVPVDTTGAVGRVITPAETLIWLERLRSSVGDDQLVLLPVRPGGTLWGYYFITVPNPPLLQVPGTGGQIAPLLVGGLALSLFVNLALFFFFGLHLERPIRRLSMAIHRIAAGDLMARTGLDRRGDELGRLARDLDAMAARLQEAREQARSAEVAHRYLVAAASHDLRTPLTALLAHAEALKSGVADQPELSLAVIEEKGLQIKRLTDDLFELAALDATRTPWQTVRMDLTEVVRRAVLSVFAACEAAGITVEADIPDGPLWADLAPGKLERVLDNLQTNALKYGAAGRWLGVRVDGTGARLRVEVADRGPGVPEPERALIWDRFYRSDSARSQAGGSGLGLAIAREIVSRNGGTIGVMENPGGGACFWLELPRAQA